MSISAILFGVAGIALLFAPDELAPLLRMGVDGSLAVSLWGGALFGFGVMNWTARSAVVGGIYGRPVVAGNQAHAFVGLLVLTRMAFDSLASWPFLVLLLLYLVHAAFFSYLMFFASPSAE